MINKEWIEQIFYQLIATQSDTNTPYEKVIEDALVNIIGLHPYFKKHPDRYGLYHLEDDLHNRSVVWCFVKGVSDKTVVMINHHDAVDIQEYGPLGDFALRPTQLKGAMKKRNYGKEVTADLENDKWIFGRATADMKGGTALQLGVIDYFCHVDKPAYNVLYLSVPDEESLSKGMLTGVSLLTEFRTKFNFDYQLMINSEPYFNQKKGKAIMHEGSVGKIMPVLYIRGIKSHISDPFSGVNPSLILSEIQRRTELNPAMCDINGLDASPPPVWINLKDHKKAYDASIPEAAVGYFNWLTFSRSPKDVINNMKMIAKHAMTDVLVRHQQAYDAFCLMNHEESENLDYQGKIYTYEMLYKEALEAYGEDFQQALANFVADLKPIYNEGHLPLPEATLSIVEFVCDYVDLQGPAVVLGLSGPYYPHISNNHIKDGNRYNLQERINSISEKHFGVTYESQNFFMGMCDLSYAGFVGSSEDIDKIKENSPGWDILYGLPFEDMTQLSMPVLNLGPWGKDLHKTTERVYGPDVFYRIPKIIIELLEEI